MTHLVEAIESLRDVLRVGLPRPRLPDPAPSARALAVLGAADAAPAAPTGAVLEALRQRLLAAYGAGGSGRASMHELRDAPWVLWQGQPPLCRLPRLAEEVYGLAGLRRGALRNLIEAWLRCFEPGGPGIAEAGERIRALLSEHDDLRMELWKAAQARTGLFEAARGPRRVAEWLLDGPEPVPNILSKVGLDDPLRGVGGYARVVQDELLVALPPRLRDQRAQAGLGRGCEFLVHDKALRFPEIRGAMAGKLLAAWEGGTRQPAEPILRGAIEFLLRHLGDPRLHPTHWIDAGEAAIALVRRWLTRASLDAFFELISEFAEDRMWRWRKTFWHACMEHCNRRGIAFDAWLALGPRVYASARAVRDLGGAYARLHRPPLREQSVLLMKVGPLVLCEWSHNGKLRAWMSDWENAPTLHRTGYDRQELMVRSLPFPPNPATRTGGDATGNGLTHFSPASGHWQGSAAELLARRAGVRLTSADWTPR